MGWVNSVRCCAPSGGQGATPRSTQAIWIKPFQRPPAAPPSLLPYPDPVPTNAARPPGCRVSRLSAQYMKEIRHSPSLQAGRPPLPQRAYSTLDPLLDPTLAMSFPQ